MYWQNGMRIILVFAGFVIVNKNKEENKIKKTIEQHLKEAGGLTHIRGFQQIH